ncbi:hypothetical protein [Kitasatospora sp. NPDC088134]|uniref:hypothetical protein n=1 Tax=Kitasatospora sp. NPDC088134 TaxID=3364071 RepID=UPI0037F8B95B
MAAEVRVRGRAAHSAVLRELLLLWEAARRVGGRTVTQKRLARLGGIGPSTLNGWLAGRSVPRELDRLTAVAGELARAAGRPAHRATYWSALMAADRADDDGADDSGADNDGADDGRRDPGDTDVGAADVGRAGTGHRPDDGDRAGAGGPDRHPDRSGRVPGTANGTANGAAGGARHGAADGTVNGSTNAATTPTTSTGAGVGRHRERAGPTPAGRRLLSRYRAAPPAARALVDAGVDAMRLGHGPALPAVLLVAAAPHYLTDSERGALGAGWVAEAMVYLRRAVPGTGTLLTVDRTPGGATAPPGRGSAPDPDRDPVPGEDARDDRRVRLAEALARQSVREREREGRPVPPGLWDCLVRHADPADRAALARAAAGRGYTRTAIALCASAVEAGEAGALSVGAAMLAEAGRVAEAVDWYGAAADLGVPEAPMRAAKLLEQAGQDGQAVEWLDRAGRAGDADALCRAAELLGRRGEIEPALLRFERAARAGHPNARYRAGRLLTGLGRAEEALEWFERAAADGHPEAAAACARSCAAAGRTEQAVTWWERAWEQGSPTAVHEAARMLEAAGRVDEAAAWWERAAASGDEAAWPEAAAMLSRQGQYGNLPWYAHLGDHHALRDRAEQCERAGDFDGALAWYRKAADAGSETALFQAADLLERRGDRAGAVRCYQLAARYGDAYAMRELGRLLGELGRQRESADWYLAAHRAGDRQPLPDSVQLLLHLDGRTATAPGEVPALPAPAFPAPPLPAPPLPAPAPAALRPAVEGGSANVRPDAADFRHDRTGSRPVERTSAEQQGAERRGTAGLEEAVDLLKDAGRYFEADLLLRATERPEPERLREAARMLSGSVGTDGAIDWVQRLAGSGDRQAAREAAEMLEGRGRIEEALDWYRRAAEGGDRDALIAGARMLVDRRRTGRALEWYRRAAEAGDPLAHREAMMLLQECEERGKFGTRARSGGSTVPEGEEPEAAEALTADRWQHGWEPDARAAAPWHAAVPVAPTRRAATSATSPEPGPSAVLTDPPAPGELKYPGELKQPRVPRQSGGPARTER